MKQNIEKEEAMLTCPHCEAKHGVSIPQNSCLAFSECSACEKLIKVPEGSSACCVICEYSDSTCPTSHA